MQVVEHQATTPYGAVHARALRSAEVRRYGSGQAKHHAPGVVGVVAAGATGPWPMAHDGARKSLVLGRGGKSISRGSGSRFRKRFMETQFSVPQKSKVVGGVAAAGGPSPWSLAHDAPRPYVVGGAEHTRPSGHTALAHVGAAANDAPRPLSLVSKPSPGTAGVVHISSQKLISPPTSSSAAHDPIAAGARACTTRGGGRTMPLRSDGGRVVMTMHAIGTETTTSCRELDYQEEHAVRTLVRVWHRPHRAALEPAPRPGLCKNSGKFLENTEQDTGPIGFAA